MRDNINNSTKQQDKTDSVAVIGAFVASMLFPWIMMLFGAVVYHMFVL